MKELDVIERAVTLISSGQLLSDEMRNQHRAAFTALATVRQRMDRVEGMEEAYVNSLGDLQCANAKIAELRSLLKMARRLLIQEGDPEEDGEMIAQIDAHLAAVGNAQEPPKFEVTCNLDDGPLLDGCPCDHCQLAERSQACDKT